jgi:hypothetical protein
VHFALVVYPQFEVLDAFGPTEVLHCLAHPMIHPNSQDMKLSIIGPELVPVSTGPVDGDPSHLKSMVSQAIVPTHTFDAPPKDVDVLIVPGGFGAGPKALFGGTWEPPCAQRVVSFLREQYPSLKHLLSKSSRLSVQHLTKKEPSATVPVLLHELVYSTATKPLPTNNCGLPSWRPARRRTGYRRPGKHVYELPSATWA